MRRGDGSPTRALRFAQVRWVDRTGVVSAHLAAATLDPCRSYPRLIDPNPIGPKP